MKTENIVGEDSLINLFRKLYDQQFPPMKSCFELLAIESKIENTKKENHTHNEWLIRIGYLLLAVFAFNFQFADHIKAWGSSPYHTVVMWVTLGCAVSVLISAFIKFEMHYSPIITKCEIELCRGGFYYYKDAEKLFTSLIYKCSWYNLKTPNDLAHHLEERVRFLVFLIKSSEVNPNYSKGKTEGFLKDEADLLKKLIELICLLGLMKTNEIAVITGVEKTLQTRTDWLYKKLFDEVSI